MAARDEVKYCTDITSLSSQEMLRAHVMGESGMLLIGNQGVGKNKLADRLLQVLELNHCDHRRSLTDATNIFAPPPLLAPPRTDPFDRS